MDAVYTKDSDIVLSLTDEEDRMLLSGQTKFFYEMQVCSKFLLNGNHHTLLRTLCKALSSYVFLGCSEERLRGATGLDAEMGEIVVPVEKEAPWMINLSEVGLKNYRDGWGSGVRYSGGSKLFIIGPS